MDIQDSPAVQNNPLIQNNPVLAQQLSGAPAGIAGGVPASQPPSPMQGQMPPNVAGGTPQQPFSIMKNWATDENNEFKDLDENDLKILGGYIQQNPKVSQSLNQQTQKYWATSTSAGDKRKDTLIGLNYINQLLSGDK